MSEIVLARRRTAAYQCSDLDCRRIYPVFLDEQGLPDVGGFDLRCPACSSCGRDTGLSIEHFQPKRRPRRR